MAGIATPEREIPSGLDDATSERLLLRVELAAHALDLSRSQVCAMIATGELPSIKIGRSRRVPVAALRRWIEDQAAA